MLYRLFTIGLLTLTFTVTASAELPLRIGADQQGKNRFVGGVARFSFYETLTDDDVAALAKTKPGESAVLGAAAKRVTLASDKTFSKNTFAGVEANVLNDSHFIEFPADVKMQKIGAAEGWIYLDEKNQGNCRIFDRITPGGQDGWLLDLHPGHKLRLIYRNETVLTNAVLPVKEWVHVAAVFDEDDVSLFVNGKAVNNTGQGRVLSDKTPPKHHEIVWSSKPATQWFDAMPLGNGRLGAMIPGNVQTEVIGLNDDTLWSGEHRLELQKPETYKVLPEIRKLLFDGKNEEAQKKIDQTMIGPRQFSYQPVGNLVVQFQHEKEQPITDYRRELDLREGIVRSSYTVRGTHFEREHFASYPADVIVFTFRADKPVINADVQFVTPHKTFSNLSRVSDNGTITSAGFVPIDLAGKTYDINKGTRFAANFKVVAEKGTVTASENGTLSIRNADTVRIYFTASTSYIDPWTNPAVSEDKVADMVKKNDAALQKTLQKSFAELKQSHVNDYQSLYNRVKLDIAPTESAKLPMETRLKQYSPESDPQLAALYYQFGRYLLIAGSRPGSQPMNLQGIWNKDVQPAWGSKWTLNCNAEINYWGIGTANLAELREPIVRMTKELSVDGAKTAKNLYNARGWVAHHNTDIWRTSGPIDGGCWGMFQTGGAWLCQTVYDHYLYTGDKKYLAEVYPLIAESARFYLDTLQKDPNGYLTVNPSLSFENVFKKPDGFVGWISAGATQEIQIVRATLRNTLEAAKILGKDAAMQEELAKTLALLPPNKVSPTRGDLQEWVEDWDTAGPGNGQIGHGWGLNPDWQISPITTPELAAAIRKTLETRKPWVYSCASWTGSMAAGNFARLLDGQMVEMILDRHVRLTLRPSLISRFHEAGGSWQNDGNLGMMSAIGEMLLQSHPSGEQFEVHILPASMPSWKSGKVEGLCARGGFTVDITWLPEDVSATIHSTWGTKCRVRFGDKVEEIDIPLGETKRLKWKR
ncbi:alpha/beta hydrolase [Planctomycetales bacterium]|nr:alpha/beta hydrolase [Planctomycetales bacterium]